MAELQNTEERMSDRDWLVEKLAQDRPGDFLRNFISTCLWADSDNFVLMVPVIKQIRQKYPLKKHPLNEQETHGQPD